jgi:hypothetical protein
MSVDKREVTINSANPTLSVTAWLGVDLPTVTGGYGGWQMVARPRRQALTAWMGHEPFSMDLPLLLDGFVNNFSVEARCSALERMARPPKEGDEPPLVKVIGPVPHADLTWVINSIRWGDALRSSTGPRVRQFVTLSLVKYIADDRVQLTSAAARARAKAVPSSTAGGKPVNPTAPYVVKAGDTLSSIAASILGDYNKWRDIAKLNDIRDPKSIRVGQKLRMP